MTRSARPAPWTVADGYEQLEPGIYIVDADGVVVLTDTWDADVVLDRELAERIVCAVNAAERVTEPAAPATTPADVAEPSQGCALQPRAAR